MDSYHLIMDTGSTDRPEARSEGLAAEKRPVENGKDHELGVSPVKKARRGNGMVENVKKAAEIVLVLAAMGKMRGGRSPTPTEKKMIAEARENLVEICEDFAPKDIFPRDAFETVIEDLGLSKLREQRLGFGPPKMSIAEKLLLTKQKMEKSGPFSLRTAVQSSLRLQKDMGSAAESRGASHATRTSSSDKPSHALVSSEGFQPASLGHISAANSTSLPYQLPASEVRTPNVSSGLGASDLGRNSSATALSRVDVPHSRLDSRSNGSCFALHIQDPSGDHSLLKYPAWSQDSQQSQSTSTGKTGQDSKALLHPPVKGEGTVKMEGTADANGSSFTPQAAASKPLISQTISGHLPTMHQHVQGMKFVQAPLNTNIHSEIGKIVQKILQPKHSEQPKWIPPSRDYMNKALTCQLCKLTITEVENVLICDACEKGYHLKCLQSHNQKGVPRVEWHCFKCLSLSNGKPLPPKYGRVTRNTNASNIKPSAAAAKLSPGKVGTLGEKGNQQNITANGSSGFQSAPAGSIGKHPASGSNMPNARRMHGNNILSAQENLDYNHHSETYPNSVAISASAVGSSVETSNEEKMTSELNGEASAKPSETDSKKLDHLQAFSNRQYNDKKVLLNSAGNPLLQCNDNGFTSKVSDKSRSGKKFHGNQDDCFKQKEQGFVRAESIEISGTSNHAQSSLDTSDYVDWIGDLLQIVDGRKYYQSCCVNGVVYKVQDYALLHSSDVKLMPSKLQAMWEDSKTRLKWVRVNLCYFPSDLPDAVGHPCSPESNEVYESNHGSTIKAGFIRGPCNVLPPGKFIEESERRSRLGTGVNNGLRPLFLCKWFYDESRCVFRDVSC